MASVAIGEWTRAQSALREEIRRVTELLRSVRNPGAPALGHWSAAEVAMHLSQAWLAVPGLARKDLSGVYDVLPGLEAQAGDSLMLDVWDLSGVTTMGVRADEERDLHVLADRIEQRAEGYFAGFAGASGGPPSVGRGASRTCGFPAPSRDSTMK